MNDIKSSKNAFYRTLDVVYKNSDKLLEHLRLMVEKELKEKQTKFIMIHLLFILKHSQEME
ncbi:hypothetical protein ONA02_04160 [Mycoplasmopsis felis]|nr:hypothetical protein [Mycoplasmopsis felis]WAM01841.1 hypothetical protein ONA02_04160 [Mycoplasmopsis felis]